MSKEELIKNIETGKVKVITNAQMWVTIVIFLFTTVFGAGVVYATIGQRLNIVESKVQTLEEKESNTLLKQSVIKEIRDKQWHEIQMNMKNICKALNIPYEKID